MAISQYDALYAVIGTTYGGDGVTNFKLPDLQGRVAIGQGQGPGLPNFTLGAMAGTETHALIDSEMPAHSHALLSSSTTADTSEPGPTVHLATASAGTLYAPPSGLTYNTMAPCLNAAGNNIPHENMMPSVVCNYCICYQGIFPSPG